MTDAPRLTPRLLLAAAPLLLTAFHAGAPTGAQAAPESPYGKTPTDRSIELSAVIDGTPEEVFSAWTTASGANRFFGVDATIEPRVGGVYEIYFLSRDHPEAEANSSRGARVLEIDPPRRLAFEWAAPPFASELNTSPLPTWVEIELQSPPADPSRTLLHLSHRGFGDGPLWDRVHAFFERNWFEIVYRLKRDFEAGTPSG